MKNVLVQTRSNSLNMCFSSVCLSTAASFLYKPPSSRPHFLSLSSGRRNPDALLLKSTFKLAQSSISHPSQSYKSGPLRPCSLRTVNLRDPGTYLQLSDGITVCQLHNLNHTPQTYISRPLRLCTSRTVNSKDPWHHHRHHHGAHKKHAKTHRTGDLLHGSGEATPPTLGELGHASWWLRP